MLIKFLQIILILSPNFHGLNMWLLKNLSLIINKYDNGNHIFLISDKNNVLLYEGPYIQIWKDSTNSHPSCEEVVSCVKKCEKVRNAFLILIYLFIKTISAKGQLHACKKLRKIWIFTDMSLIGDNRKYKKNSVL